jgi:hypothetical protein
MPSLCEHRVFSFTLGASCSLDVTKEIALFSFHKSQNNKGSSDAKTYIDNRILKILRNFCWGVPEKFG